PASPPVVCAVEPPWRGDRARVLVSSDLPVGRAGVVVSAVMSRLVQRVMSLPPPLDRRVGVARGVRVPMDDGVELAADVYTPASGGSHPTILVRSPYGRGGPLGLLLGRVFAERGYRVVMQSCRGTFGSGGVFQPNFHERAD